MLECTPEVVSKSSPWTSAAPDVLHHRHAIHPVLRKSRGWISRLPLKRLAYSRIDLLWQSAAASVYISREHGRLRTTRNFVGDLCLYHSLLIYSCMFITLHDHLKSLRDSKPPVLGTRGPRDRSHDVSVYETCACVIINLFSYMCI